MIWRCLFDARSPTWAAYGRAVFVEADSAVAAEVTADIVAGREYPGSTIHLYEVRPSSEAEWERWRDHRRRLEEWARLARTASAPQRGLL